ncbi:hypothetical protein [Candidatus Chrysopegis kryptomonas]|uniref:Uncharacterized protein n=1 Tax=Candidatus Chryseopegocella kryptomonas TaxID=1633643 RepID=A0A0P1NWG1_9BACT|nr:hypothetical protein [Candidatus Chrysopegis kryptomonas]CUT03476.1 hypothetical protein JGI23_01484 [Candidatus Chrysopegis kryptomonas]
MIKRITPAVSTKIQNVKQNEGKTMIVEGKVQQVNERGLKINDRWYNFSRFLTKKPTIAVNDSVKFIASGNFINDFISIEKAENPLPKGPKYPLWGIVPNKETQLLEALRSATKIASIIENEVSIKFSAQDIIKLALTLFIQQSDH